MCEVLLISTCKEKLHELEFVKPIEDILNEINEHFFVKHYSKVSKKDLGICSKVIICGTSIKDDFFLKDLKSFNWLKFFNKPVLGICAGMQILGRVYGGKPSKKTEIGFFHEKFVKDFLGIKGKQEVYHLHNNYVSFESFERFTNAKIPQAVKHKEKEIYGVLFHPEVRQKGLIKEFINKK